MFNSVLPRLLHFAFVGIKRLLSLHALQLAYVEKVHPPPLGDDGGLVIVGQLILSYQSNCWQAGYDMGRGVMDLCWTCLKTYLELLKSPYLVSLYSNLMDQFEGSRRFDDHQWNSSAASESLHVIILKSCLNSTGLSACTRKVRDILDRQTYVPNDWWQLMCSHVLQPWDCRSSMTTPVRNISV